MFPEKLLDVELRDGRLLPRYLTSRNHLWVEALLDALEGCTGRARASVERRLGRLPDSGARPLALRAMTHLLLNMRGFAVRPGPAPALLRRTVFEEAGRASPGTPREAVLEAAASVLGLPPAELEGGLFADVPAERLLRPLREALGTAEALERYNLALAQGVLLRAETLAVTVDGGARAVLRFARLQRLLCLAERIPGPAGGVRLVLSGPLSIFRHTAKYGRAMADWLPVVLHAPGWQLEATCRFRDRRLLWREGNGAPLRATHAPPGRFDSALEEQLFRDLQRLGSPWQVLREGDPVQVGRSIHCPDFLLLDSARGLRVPVEVVGFWTPDYLRSKGEAMRGLPAGHPWLLCVDESLCCREELGQLPGPVFSFRGRIDAGAFLVFLEEWIRSRAINPLRAAPGACCA